MHGTFFDIGLGAGLAAACGLRPFLPALIAGALASGGDLGVGFQRAGFHFLAAGWWLVLLAVLLALAYALQLGLGLAPTAAAPPMSAARDGRAAGATAPSPLAATVTGLGIGIGAVLFAGTLADHHDSWWPGIVGGIACAALAQRVAEPIIAGARARLADHTAREALTVYLDLGALLAAALVCLLHPLGYLLLALLAFFYARRRARAAEKYAGLRILRR